MNVYSSKRVARMLDLSVDQVRSFARDGLLQPARGPRGEYRFSFRDLVLLRTAKGLLAAKVPPRTVRVALKRLRQQLPRNRPLTGLQISADGDRIRVRDGETVWDPESGQACFNFDIDELVQSVARHAQPSSPEPEVEDDMGSEDWFTVGHDLEGAAPEHAREAYRRALELEPDHVDARVNLGRLLHEEGHLDSAEAHYRLALSLRPDEATSLYNLAVCLEDQGKLEQAIAVYRQTLDADPFCADAHYNIAGLLEKRGDSPGALRHLKIYRELSEG